MGKKIGKFHKQLTWLIRVFTQIPGECWTLVVIVHFFKKQKGFENI
jgi:hypothetical protein